MAIVIKELFMKDICNRVGRRAVYFDKEDRPALEMGGQKVFISSVSYDESLGRMTYSVVRPDGSLALSAHGPRMLDSLSVRLLSEVSASVRRVQEASLSRYARKILERKEPKRLVKGITM